VGPKSRPSVPYGVGAGDSAGDGEGDSVAPSVFGGVFFAALCFRGGVGVGLAAAGAVVVAVVPCCCVQEATNATPIKALIKTTMYFFIGVSFSSGVAECSVAWAIARNKSATKPQRRQKIASLTTGGATRGRAIYLRDASLGPCCTREDLCPDANAKILCRAEIDRR
jgi:hypothetical protein